MKKVQQGTAGALALLLSMAPVLASQALKDTIATISLEAKKLDPTTHAQVWSIITNHLPSLTPLFGRQVHLSSTIIRSSAKGILVFKDQPTYFFIYKNNKSSEEPVMSVITPEDIEETGSNPILVLDTYGSVIITSQKEYENMLKAQQIAFSPSDQDAMIEKKSSIYHIPSKVVEKISTQVEQPFTPFVPEAPAFEPAATSSVPEAPAFDLDMSLKTQPVKPVTPKKGESAFIPFVPEAPPFNPEQPKSSVPEAPVFDLDMTSKTPPIKPVEQKKDSPTISGQTDKQVHLTAIEKGVKLKPVATNKGESPEKSELELKLEKIREATQAEEEDDYSKEDWD